MESDVLYFNISIKISWNILNIEIKYGSPKGNNFSSNGTKSMLEDTIDIKEAQLILGFTEFMIRLIIKMWYGDFNFCI